MPSRPSSPRRGISRHKGKTKGPRAWTRRQTRQLQAGYVARTLKREDPRQVVSVARQRALMIASADSYFSISRFLDFSDFLRSTSANEDLRSAISRRQRPAAASASPPRICERIGLIRLKERTERIRLKTRGAD